MSTAYSKITPGESRKKVEDIFLNSLSQFMKTGPAMEDIPCPFCEAADSEITFQKQEFIFRTCKSCRSLYNSPRLTPDSVASFHKFADLTIKHFELAAEQRQQRIELLMKPRWKTLKQYLTRHGISFPVNQVMEVGPGVGYFTETIHQDNCSKKYIEVEMDKQYIPFLEQLKGVEVLNSALEEVSAEIHGKNDIIFINSVIEHPPRIFDFFLKLFQCLTPGGFVALVDMHCDGFDHKILRELTPNILPVNILQVGSIEGIHRLSERAGLKVVEVFSVGSMDTDIVFDITADSPDNRILSGMREVLGNAKFRSELQQLLRDNLLTGYNGYILRRPE